MWIHFSDPRRALGKESVLVLGPLRRAARRQTEVASQAGEVEEDAVAAVGYGIHMRDRQYSP